MVASDATTTAGNSNQTLLGSLLFWFWVHFCPAIGTKLLTPPPVPRLDLPDPPVPAPRHTLEPLERASKRASQAKGRRYNPSGHARLVINRLLVWSNELLNFSVRHVLPRPADVKRDKL